jgi:hypothetical protein
MPWPAPVEKCAYDAYPLRHATARGCRQKRKVRPVEQAISASWRIQESFMKTTIVKLIAAFLMVAGVYGCASMAGGSPESITFPESYGAH